MSYGSVGPKISNAGVQQGADDEADLVKDLDAYHIDRPEKWLVAGEAFAEQ